MKKLQTKAARHGTFVSPTTGEIMYVDPDHKDERHHSPLLTDAEAKEAFKRSLIDDPDEASEVDDSDKGAPVDPNLIGKVAAEVTEQFAEADAAGGPGSGTLDSRSSTAWPDRARVEGGAEGFTDGIRDMPADIEAESGDADAPPVVKKGRKPAATNG